SLRAPTSHQGDSQRESNDLRTFRPKMIDPIAVAASSHSKLHQSDRHRFYRPSTQLDHFWHPELYSSHRPFLCISCHTQSLLSHYSYSGIWQVPLPCMLYRAMRHWSAVPACLPAVQGTWSLRQLRLRNLVLPLLVL